MKKIFFKSILFFLLLSHITGAHHNINTPRATKRHDKKLSLDELALLAGTDKSSAWHDYTNIYSSLFFSLRHKPIKLLEIGIFKGNSVELWDRYFTNPSAILHFIDLYPLSPEECKMRFSNRVSCFQADQENSESLKKFIEQAGGQYDIIIDDGGHTMRQQQVSFETLFPTLKSNGIYIIEDLFTSYWEVYGAKKDVSTVHFLASLLHDINFIGAQNGCADYKKFDATKFTNYYQKNIKSMCFYCSLCCLIKR